MCRYITAPPGTVKYNTSYLVCSNCLEYEVFIRVWYSSSGAGIDEACFDTNGSSAEHDAMQCDAMIFAPRRWSPIDLDDLTG